MPIAHKYSLDELMEAARYYVKTTRRRITFEYSLVKGVNDGRKQAEELAGLVRGLNCHINLIPVNPIKEREYEQADTGHIAAFRKMLEDRHIPVTVRREMGRDISAACGLTAGLGGAVRTKAESVLGGKFTSLYKGTAKSGAQNSVRYLEYVSKGDVSQKVYKTLLTNNRAATTQNLKLIKGGGTLANDVTQDIIQKLFG